MIVGIYTNLDKDKDLLFTKKLMKQLDKQGLPYQIYENLHDYFDCDFFNDDCINVDIMFSLGGDGTILRLVKICAIKNIPIIGLNLGTIGFLTEDEPNNLDKLLNCIKNNDYSVEYRTMLTAYNEKYSAIALNDIVVSRENSRLVVLDVYVNSELVDRYYCDGFIVCTPTGSTAYSLSAGGPILTPNANVLALTSINSHSLHTRPIVINDNDTIEIAVQGERGTAVVVADGNNEWQIENNEKIHIKKSKLKIGFIRINDNSFYDKLLTKLNKWGVTNKEEL